MKLPQLSVRDLFYLVLVAGIGLGWWVERAKLIADAKAMQRDWLQETRLTDQALKRAGMELITVPPGDHWELAPLGTSIDFRFDEGSFRSHIPQQ